MSTSPETGGGREPPISIRSHARRPWTGSTPTPLTPLIGRAEERARVRDLVDNGARLLTLHGPGGIGKTRLALQLALDLQDEFADGIAWVPLAAVRDVDAVLPSIAKTLGIDESPNHPALMILRSALHEGRHLLMLDNLEQVLAAGGQLAELLAACPRLVVLATSRSLLRVTGEHAIDVPPLALSEPQTAATGTGAAHAEAIQLFVARARAVSPGFRFDEASAPLVADICRHLEGVPLAIELAAARANHLSMPSLRSRLQTRLQLLSGGGRDQPARHRTMRDAIAWSYDLLTDNERLLFRRLGVWSGGCRAEAVEIVGGSLGDQAAPTLGAVPTSIDSVAVLVDHSLVRQVTDPDGEPRFVMLETVREFALDCLDTSGDRALAERLKAAYLASFAERMELAPLLSGSELMLALLDLEHSNVRDSLSWLHQAGRRREALQMAGALAYSWIAQGWYREGQAWLEPLVTSPEAGSDLERAKALTGLGYMSMRQGHRARAAAAFDEAIRLWQTLESPLHLAIALNGKAGLAGEPAIEDGEKTALLGDVLALSQSIDDPRLAAFVASLVYDTLGMAANTHGQLALATEHHTRALALRRHVDFTLGICISLENLGDIARAQGDYEPALSAYREAMAIAVEHWNPPFVTDALTSAAHIALALEQPESAARLLGAADALRKELGIAISMRSDPVPSEGVRIAARQALGDAAFARAWSEGGAYTLDDAIAEVDRIVFPTGSVESDDRPSPAGLRYGLTPREIDVLRGIVERLTDREIAERHFISPRTVGWHVTGILTKLEVASRRAAAAKAIAEALT